MPEIVVGVDGSAGAARALEWAVREAALRKTDVRAVLAWAPEARSRALDERLRVARFEDLDATAADALHAAVTAAVGPRATVKIHERTAYQDPVDALLDDSVDAAMIVVGTRGQRALRRLLVGSVAATCAQETKLPLVVVRGRPGEPDDDRPVLVGVDGSPASLAALRWAAAEATLRDTGLRIVHAWHIPVYAGHPLPEPDLLREGAYAVLEKAAQELDARTRHNHRADLVAGHGSRVLIDAAAEAQLLVVGARGHGGFPGLLLGSTSHQCVLHAPCPVAVIREPRRSGHYA